jgi:hypothetical protein
MSNKYNLVIVIKNIKDPNGFIGGGMSNKYKGAYKKIFDILDEDSIFVPSEVEDEILKGNDFYLYFNSLPDADKLGRISKIPNVEILNKNFAKGGNIGYLKGKKMKIWNILKNHYLTKEEAEENDDNYCQLNLWRDNELVEFRDVKSFDEQKYYDFDMFENQIAEIIKEELVDKIELEYGDYEGLNTNWLTLYEKFEKGGRTIAQTPAPKKDRVYGSDINKKSSSKDLSTAKLIKFDDNTLDAIKNKVKKHNEEHPDKKINLSSAKAVVRRGMGAYSKSHRPTISGGKPNSRVAWGLARLNAFTYKIVNGKSKSGKYSQDDDLINELGFKVANYNYGGEMSKDIRCINCGWEWNKKDSELWDMYVCHKCGFDNTTFYTSIPINNYSRGGQTERTNPDYLKMFLGK